jgi:uncharacterized LabA/DUF88 family protein
MMMMIQPLPKPSRDFQMFQPPVPPQPQGDELPTPNSLHLLDPPNFPLFDPHSPAVPDLQNERVVILIDGANLFYSALKLGIEVDYAKLLCHLTQGRRLVRAYFYTGVDPHNDKQQGFLLWMRRNGYRVVTKDLVQLPDGSKKADLDVEIVVDMMTLASYCDTMVLLSGDGDLTYAVNHVAYRGVQVEVVGLRSMTNEHLIAIADRYFDLETLKADVQKSHPSRSPIN